jgi:hypothetical protein
MQKMMISAKQKKAAHLLVHHLVVQTFHRKTVISMQKFVLLRAIAESCELLLLKKEEIEFMLL